MPELKNQHFVPKVHLRAFAPDEGKKMVNLLHASSLKAIRGVSLSDQCAKHYFYGKNLELEKALGTIEGSYGAHIRSIDAGDRSLELLSALRDLSFFQHFRTDAARKKLQAMQQELADTAGVTQDDGQAVFSNEELVRNALATFVQSLHVVADLRTCLVINMTKFDFVSSDDPAVLFNKFINQKERSASFGLTNSGLSIYMPLGPRVGILAYDANVYQVEQNARREILVNKFSDVVLLNSLVMMNNANCVFFQNWTDADVLLGHLKAALPFRTTGSRTTELIPVEGVENAYRALKADEIYDGRVSIVFSENVFPQPRSWMSFFKTKSRAVTFSNGTAVGYVRKKEWLRRLPIE